ncbi:hypothetical protein C8R44DRAFT_728244 [Mycena epipterygia]|nr:hypothetical protein C8R44DRAFT_728244 [Mycena epipterygia]
MDPNAFLPPDWNAQYDATAFGAFDMSMPPVSFDNFSGYNVPNPAYNQPSYNSTQNGTRQSLGGVVNQPSHDSLIAELVKRIQQLEVDMHQKVLTRIADLERQLGETTASQALTQKALDDIRAADKQEQTRKRQKVLEDGALKNNLQSAIHETCKGLLGIGHRDPQTNVTVVALPHALQPGEALGTAATDAKFRPVWSAGNANSVNTAFIDHVVKVVNERVLLDAGRYGITSQAEISSATKIYFRTLRTTYALQNDPAQAVKYGAKKAEMRQRGRATDKAGDLRKGVDILIEKHGEEATVGAYELVLTDYMSSEHSDCGELTKAEWEEHKKLMGGGSLETRQKAWLSKNARIFYGYLRSLKREKEALNDTRGDKKSIAGRAKLTRFKGHAKNINNTSSPVVPGRIPYDWMVSAVWKAAAESDGKTEIHTVGKPSHFTIFSLPLTMNDLDAEEQAYLGDDESA